MKLTFYTYRKADILEMMVANYKLHLILMVEVIKLIIMKAQLTEMLHIILHIYKQILVEIGNVLIMIELTELKPTHQVLDAI